MSTKVLPEEQVHAALLHNMSHRPTASATRRGVHCARLVRIHVRSVLATHRAEGATAAALCSRVGVTPAPGQCAEDALAAWVDRKLDEIDFPQVATVVADRTPGALELDCATDHLLAVAIAVATRSTDSVFLRGKRPLWSRLHANDSVVLVLPAPPPEEIADDDEEEHA